MSVNDLHLKLSQEIIDLCRREGYAVGYRLTERNLATRLGVSRSPVRAALQYLSSQNIVTFEPGSGYSLQHSGSKLERHLLNVPRPTDEDIYLAILKDRFAGRLARQVSEADLMRRYSVARGALQKVLLRLAREGFAHRGHGHGWIFHEMLNTVQAYRASYEIRIAVEPAAILSSNFELDNPRFNRLLKTHQQLGDDRGNKEMTRAKVFELDAELHEAIALCSANQFFVETVRYHNQLRRIVEYESFAANERMDESNWEHVQIIQTLLAGDVEWAAAAMTQHLKLARNSIEVFPDQPTTADRTRNS